MTKSQINKLGKILRSGRSDEETLRMLDALYGEYEPTAQMISRNLVEARLGDILTQRPTKSLLSIVAKLRRERGQLSSMQDIIGCRLVVRDRFQQADLENHLTNPRYWDGMIGISSRSEQPNWPGRMTVPPFRDTVVTDRNRSPRSGYRAVHVIVRDFGHPYEIQIRTGLQNRWAQLAERSDDLFPGTKYGAGHAGVLDRLVSLSERIAAFELDEEHVVLQADDTGSWADDLLSRRFDQLEVQSGELDGEFRAIEAYLRTLQS